MLRLFTFLAGADYKAIVENSLHHENKYQYLKTEVFTTPFAFIINALFCLLEIIYAIGELIIIVLELGFNILYNFFLVFLKDLIIYPLCMLNIFFFAHELDKYQKMQNELEQKLEDE